MKNLKDICRIAVVQAAPVMFNKDACVDKAVRSIHEAADNGAELIVFPELFIPCYPVGLTFGFRVGSRREDGREDWKKYYDQSVMADGPEMRKIIDSAIDRKVYISIGYSERDPVGATLYNSNLFISPEGITVNHRKIKPTGSERVVWGDGNKDCFPVMDTPWGPLGCMICWESYMPLARAALYQKGITIYISANTNDNKEWQDTVRHIAIEGHVYFVNCDMFFTRDMYPADLNAQEEIAKLPEIVCRGGSNVIDPFGHPVTETLWDREGILYADLDMQKVPASRMEFDAAGHYSRPDLLDLRVNDL